MPLTQFRLPPLGPHQQDRGERLQLYAAGLGVVCLFGSLLTLVGWLGGVHRFTDWFGLGISMKANAALASSSASLALLLQCLRPQARLALRLLAAGVAALGGFTLLEHVTGWNPGLDTLLFDELPGTLGTVAPGRMGPPASLSFLLIGAALILLNSGRPRYRLLGGVLGLLAVSLALLALTGYLYEADLMYAASHYSGISLQMAILLFLLGIGVLLCDRRQPYMSILLEHSAAGLLARRVLPFVLCFPILLGWLRVLGQSSGFFDANFGSALRTLLEVLLLGGLLAWTVRRIRAFEQAAQASESRISDILSSITDGFVAFDADWRYTFVNDEASQLLRRERSALIGKSIWEVFPELAGGATWEHLQRAARLRGSVEFEDYYPSLERWAMVKAYPAAEDGMALYIQDITARKRVEEALQDKEQQLQHITDNAAVMVAQFDLQLHFTYLNKTCADFFGKPIQAIVGQPLAGVLGDSNFRMVEPFLARVLAGERVEFEHLVPRADGRQRWLRGVYVPDRDRQGRLRGWIASLNDTTDRKAAEEALRQADKRKDEFLAMLAHELRNPLAPVLNCVELLDRLVNDDPAVRDILATLRRQMVYLVRLLDDLLDVSRISRGKIDLRRQPLDLAELLRHAVDMGRPLAEDMQQSLELRLPEGPIPVQADPARLAQVFGNLLNNACRYTVPGGRIEVNVSRQVQCVEISVRDNGIGIPPEHLEDIFQMFCQVDRSLERTAGGLGIGLHLVKQLMAMHGGSVQARSEGPGKGSEFLLSLPLAEPAALDPTPLPSGAAVPAAGTHILVVDDNLDSATSLAMLLRLSGHEVEEAYDGTEALRKVAQFLPEVILLDIGLPGMNGYDCCRCIREQPQGRDCLIIALTGWGQVEDRRKSREAGFDAHLVKPLDFQALNRLLADRAGRPDLNPAPLTS